jgi:microsomal dipeptidase-like Zn-dependent dipeptidase
MMIDISHVADKTFFDVLALTTGAGDRLASSMPRDREPPAQHDRRDDERARQNGGVCMINYHAGFLSEEFRVASEKEHGDVVRRWRRCRRKCGGNEACTTMESERIDHEAMARGRCRR